MYHKIGYVGEGSEYCYVNKAVHFFQKIDQMAIEFHTNKQMIKKWDAVSTFTGKNCVIP